MSVINSSDTSAHRSARATSSGLHANSPRIPLGVDLSYASLTLDSDTDLLPYVSRIDVSFGRLMPTGVIGPESPVSTTMSMAFATIPVTDGFRYFGSQGMWSSNHCAFSATFLMRAV